YGSTRLPRTAATGRTVRGLGWASAWQNLLRLVGGAGLRGRAGPALRSDHRAHLWRVPQALEPGIRLEPGANLAGVFPGHLRGDAGNAGRRPPGGSVWGPYGDPTRSAALWPQRPGAFFSLPSALALLRHLPGHGGGW